MTRKEAVNWLINLSADIGKAEYKSLWHYEQALSEIRDLFESESQAELQEGEWENITTCTAEEACVETLQQMRCSVCKRWHTEPYIYYVKPSNYCPNCGAKMKKG